MVRGRSRAPEAPFALMALSNSSSVVTTTSSPPAPPVTSKPSIAPHPKGLLRSYVLSGS